MISAAFVATVLANEGGTTTPGTPVALSSSTTLPVAIIGAVSIVVVALVPELFRWLRRNTPEATPSTVVTPVALEAAEARITAGVEVRVTQALERANAARTEVRALRKVMEAMRDELNRHVWTTGHDSPETPAPREPVE